MSKWPTVVHDTYKASLTIGVALPEAKVGHIGIPAVVWSCGTGFMRPYCYFSAKILSPHLMVFT